MQDEILTAQPLENQKEMMAAASEGNNLLADAMKLAVITDHDSFTKACEFRVTVNKAKASRLEKLDPIRKKSFEAYQEILKLIKNVIKPFDEGMDIIDRPIAEWNDKARREREAEEERLRKEAQKQADDARLAAAETAASTGDHARAEALLNKPMNVPAPKVVAPPKVAGMSFKETWKVDELINMKLLVDAVSQGKVPLNAVEPNMTVLNQMARALKNNLNYPGVKVIMEKSVASARK